ncbi:solute carrier family 17 member 9 isoform X3 [Mustela putorius furo]|uniref:Solute carrier family 17 member 9 isoform X3 n=1 Tax=Mustela putorius furo TaxID=9669 RepID=A0A8U0RL31_MUSPF|nr:solute carrier family 17 member 9 isoform X3 [Mustela putorius furo]
MQPQPLPLEEARGDGAENTQWSRPECQTWTATLLLGTCLLYCARVSVPVCTVSMSQDFGWNKKEAGLVLSSFFWGYCLTQVVGGHLGDRIGGEKVILLSACAWGFLTAATPLLAHLSGAHLVFMTFSRILTGLLQGVYFPALTSLLSQKVRESERAFTYSTVGAGSQFGMLVTGAVGSLLLDRYGWPSVFYFSGGLTLLWVCYVYRCLLNGKGTVARPHPGLGHLGARPADVQAHQSSLETAFPEAFSLGWVFNVVPWLVAIPASLFSGFLSDHLINQAAPAGTQQGPSGPQHKWADGTVSPSPPLRLQDHHRAEVHAGREGRDEPLWTPVCSWDPRGLTSSGPTQKAFGGCPRSVLGAGLAALSASPSCVGGFSVPPSLARGPGCFPLSLTSGTGLSRSLASHIPRSGGLSSVRHGLCPATPLLPQVMGLGLSSVFALCLGHTSSFCTSVVFASASIGLQTFNHSGISVNIQDLAPSCAGFLFGVANTAGALAGVVGVCLGGYLLETTGSWASMFNLVAAVGSLGLCTFLLFGEAQRVDLSPAHEDL